MENYTKSRRNTCRHPLISTREFEKTSSSREETLGTLEINELTRNQIRKLRRHSFDGGNRTHLLDSNTSSGCNYEDEEEKGLSVLTAESVH